MSCWEDRFFSLEVQVGASLSPQFWSDDDGVVETDTYKELSAWLELSSW